MSPLQERKLLDLINELDGVVELLELLSNAAFAIADAIEVINDVRLDARAS